MKILVATDLAFVRDRVAAACGAVEGLSAEYIADRRMLERRLQADGHDVDIVLIDTQLSSFESAKDVLAIMAKLKDRTVALMVPATISIGLTRRYIVNGVKGILPHDMEPEELAHALRILLGNHAIWVGTPKIDDPLPTDRDRRLSDRELQVLAGICDGLQNKEIAHGFEIQEVTVKMHVRAIIRKLGARNRTHAAMIARNHGLIDF